MYLYVLSTNMDSLRGMSALAVQENSGGILLHSIVMEDLIH